MRFIDRDVELEILRKARELSKKKLYTLAIYGMRRVGQESFNISKRIILYQRMIDYGKTSTTKREVLPTGEISVISRKFIPILCFPLP